MGRLIYAVLVSLDGYIADSEGGFAWAEPKEDVHRYVNSLEKENSLLLLGRKMYEVMAVWDNLPDLKSQPDYIQEYEAIWKSERKMVFSTTLAETRTRNTALKNVFVKAEIESLKRMEIGNIGIGGAALASQALSLGLIDEIYLFVFPVLVGAGKRWIESRTLLGLRKMESREFGEGIGMSHYAIS